MYFGKCRKDILYDFRKSEMKKIEEKRKCVGKDESVSVASINFAKIPRDDKWDYEQGQ